MNREEAKKMLLERSKILLDNEIVVNMLNRKAIEDYDLCICEIKEIKKLNLNDFGL
ncbi:MAG: hypothetical protein UIG52_00780 [Bacteroidales bacterium]|nr:hypothetical protein [Bacteroidales bacterium]